MMVDASFGRGMGRDGGAGTKNDACDDGGAGGVEMRSSWGGGGGRGGTKGGGREGDGVPPSGMERR